MPRGMFNFTKEPGRAAGTTRINPSVAAYAGAGYQAFGDSMRVLSQAVGEVAIERHQTHKRTQVNADNAAFKTYLETEYAKSKADALKTSDPKQVAKIYDGYYGRVDSYIAGKNPDGVPNVRWDDHESMLREHLGSFRMQADAARDQRVMEIDDAASMARLQQSKNLAVKRGDYASVKSAVEDAGGLTGKTADEIELDVTAALRQTDLAVIDNLTAKIAQLNDPAEADEIVEDFEADLNSGRFEHLESDDKTKVLSNVRNEAKRARQRVQEVEDAGQAESNSLVIDFAMKNGRLPMAADRDQMDLTPETIAILDSGRYSQISPALAPMEAAGVREEIYNSDPRNDPRKQEQMNLLLRIEQFDSPGIKSLLKQDLKDQFDPDLTDTDKEIMNGIRDVFVGRDFNKKWFTFKNDGMTTEDANSMAYKAVDAVEEYRRWIQKENPSPKERMAYLNDPEGTIGQLRAAKSFKKFKAIQKENTGPSAPNLLPSLGAQGVYFVPDKDEKLFSGMLTNRPRISQ